MKEIQGQGQEPFSKSQ